jgi:hypothetical protein
MNLTQLVGYCIINTGDRNSNPVIPLIHFKGEISSHKLLDIEAKNIKQSGTAWTCVSNHTINITEFVYRIR